MASCLLLAAVAAACGGPRAPATRTTPTPSPQPTSSATGRSTPTAAGSRWGINIGAKALDPRAPRAVATASALGPLWLRTGCGWAWIEARPGRYDWRLCDEVIGRVRDAGFRVLFMTGQANHLWNTTAPADVTEPSRREQYPPADFASYARFIEELVRHYRGTVTHWEVGNEPDLKGSWAGSAADYARLLSTTFDAVKRADPQAVVVFGGLSLGGTPGSLDRSFLEKVLDDPAYPGRAKFDVMNYHHYGPQAEAKRRYDHVRGVMRVRGIERPIWVTELGTSSSGPAGSPEAQAAYLRDLGTYLFSLGIERVFWFELMDGRQDRDGTFVPERSFVDYGLLDRELRPKPAFDELRRLAR